MSLRHIACVFLPVIIVSGTGAIFAQVYPNKPVRIITAAVGGGADVAARVIAQGITAPLGQQVIVDNRGGSGGMVGGENLAKSPPDGYTLLLYGNTIWLAPFMREKTPYDPVKDFSPITLAASSPSMLVVHPSLPVKSVKELIALAKSRPGALNYGTSGTGSASHLAGELFKAMAGVDIVRVNYKGAAPAFADVVAGNVQLTFGSAALVMPYLNSGRLKPLAVTGVQPSALFPGLPTVAASGLAGYEADSTFGIFAPARTPAAIVTRLDQEIVRYLRTAEARGRLLAAGMEGVGTSPEEFAAIVKSDMLKWGKVIRDAGIREE
jgi:tripartite-type tricarboxylate transporter receptor subunit TctC